MWSRLGGAISSSLVILTAPDKGTGYHYVLYSEKLINHEVNVTIFRVLYMKFVKQGNKRVSRWKRAQFLLKMCSCVAQRFRQRYTAHGSATHVTEINKLNQNTKNVNEVSLTHIPLKALMNDSLEKCKIGRCNTSKPLNGDVCKEPRRVKYKITTQRRHRGIRDREASRIPVSRVLRKLKKEPQDKFVYAAITFIYPTNHPPFPLNCYLYPSKHRTHSPKLRLPLVYSLTNYSRKWPFQTELKHSPAIR